MEREHKRKDLKTRRLSYGVVLTVGFICVFFFGGTVTYTLFFLCLMLPALSVVHLLTVRRQVACRLALDADVVEKKQPVSYQIRLRNMSRLFSLPALRAELPRLEDGQSPVTHAALVLLPGRGLKLSLTHAYPYRGVYTMPLPRLRASDLLGLCWMPLPQAPSPLTVTVCPRVHMLDTCRLFPSLRPLLPLQSNSSSDEVTASSDSRKYQYGDPLNRIHWKLTAQKNELISRQFEAEEDAELLILLDAAPPPSGTTSALEVADRLVECVLAVLYYCLQNACPVRVLHGGPDGAVHELHQRDRASFDALFDRLTILPFDAALPLDELARYAMGVSGLFSGAAAFTAALTEESLAALSALHAPGAPAAAVYIAPDEKLPDFAVSPSFEVCVVPPGADIQTAMSVTG